MPGLMGRFSTVVKSKISKQVDRAENPSETLDYAYQRQVENLQNVKKGIADIATAKRRLALQRCASKILTSRGHRLASLSVELGALFPELLLLKRQPLLGGGDVGDPLLDVLEVLDLALICIVERLARFLGAVKLL